MCRPIDARGVAEAAESKSSRLIILFGAKPPGEGDRDDEQPTVGRSIVRQADPEHLKGFLYSARRGIRLLLSAVSGLFGLILPNAEPTLMSTREILSSLDLAAEAEALGLRFAGPANRSGWRQCRAIGRDDFSPSASFNVATGFYRDHGGDGTSLSFFDLAAVLAPVRFQDWQAAKDHFQRVAFADRNHRDDGSAVSQPKSSGNGKSANTYPNIDSAEHAYALRFKRPADYRWAYHDAHGETVAMVLRWNTPTGKVIRPAAKIGDSWKLTASPEPRPLYALPELLQSTGRVWVVEGEKAADALRAIGLTATTSPGGSKAAQGQLDAACESRSRNRSRQ